MIDKASFFLAIAQRARLLPPFRGKVRALLALYHALGLEERGIELLTTLGHPVPYRVRLHLHSLHERMSFLMDGYEADTTSFLLELFDGSGYLLDVGANIGLISIPFALGCDSAASGGPRKTEPAVVFSLEPIRSNYAVLKENIALNGLEFRVRPLCVAVGEIEKSVEISVEGNLGEGEGTGTANILSTDSTYACERIPLEVTTIDRLVASGELPADCTLVKLDTDGYDLFALQGATSLLARARPVVYGEFMSHCLRWHGQDVTDVQRFARRHGYSTLARRHPHWRFSEEVDAAGFVQDLLLVPEEKLARLSRWCR